MNAAHLPLDGIWEFQHAAAAVTDVGQIMSWRRACVPAPWQAQFDDLRDSSGAGWYRRTFQLEAGQLGPERCVVLGFGAVDYHATVWVNGCRVGEHEGGYLPFEFDVSDCVKAGDNVLVVKAVDVDEDRAAHPAFPFSEVPHGKQSWYGPIGGIWQSVWLEVRHNLHIRHLTVQTLPATGAIRVSAALSVPEAPGQAVSLKVLDVDGVVVGAGRLDGAAGEITLAAPPRLWSPEEPNLYTVLATLHVDDAPVHTTRKHCGFRTVETRAGRIYLNGQPIYLRGALDQAYYPETIYTPGSLESLEAQARAAKALGLNCLRTHIKVEDPRYYDVADRLGLLIWTEIPNWALLTEASAERGRRTFEGLLARDGHHPSIIAWTLINENWGTDLTHNPEHRAWLNAFYHQAKQLDPTRLIIDNSACVGNAHVGGDLEDFHYYTAIPDHAAVWDQWVDAFAQRSAWAWYPDYLHERRADLPLIVSEFGNWGLPDPETIREHGKEPWWFETGFQWDGSSVYPHGVYNRFEASGLARLFGSYADFARASQEHMARSLHFELTSMRARDAIAGYVVTEFTDVHWECNGLLTMQRETKHGLAPWFVDLNQNDVVLLRPARWSGLPGSAIVVQVDRKDILGACHEGIVRWQFGGQSGVLAAGETQLALTLSEAGEIELQVVWLDKAGQTRARNRIRLVCAQPAAAAARLRVVDDPALAAFFEHVSKDDLR
ncbi:MAG TPA: glycoside hydrolase family 2 TIM barrel-domain containing protein, partial [Anaerolineales bacterium]|nr:glycoside hydrolase family 2 TIM barrel-domain containing protein [Anaerolineales bacterium]